ncbi:MAG: hypothetical protein JXJ18_06540 [Rhodobacteraceae bacterium]|nr:hypothetical protein [Paracoccaceae bacterium]
MSESNNLREIEDVLSSIRRLVSEEVDVSERSAPVTGEVFLLSPALRVARGGDQALRPEPGIPAAETMDRPAEPQLAEVAPAQDEPEQDAPPAAPEVDAMASESRADADAGIREAVDPSAAKVDTFVLTAQINASAPDPETDEEDDGSLEQRIAKLEAAVAGCDDDWEPDGSEGSQSPETWTLGTVRPPEPDGPGAVKPADASSSEAETKADMQGPDAVAQDEVAAECEESEETAILDEHMLRDLISDIVREELQGPLGERISRNVRKLVQREINRALAKRDLE